MPTCQDNTSSPDLTSFGPAGPDPGAVPSRRSSIMDNASDASNYSSPENSSSVTQQRKPPRADRPCDTCRRRKSRCVKEPDQDKCYLCTFHRRECTYLDEPQRRKKRKVEGPNGHVSSEQAGTGGSYVEMCESGSVTRPIQQPD